MEKQHDDDFGRTTALRAPINEGPFYAIQIAPGVHHTMGGVTINTETCGAGQQPQRIAGSVCCGVRLSGASMAGNRIGGNARWQISLFLVRLQDIRRLCVRKHGKAPVSPAARCLAGAHLRTHT